MSVRSLSGTPTRDATRRRSLGGDFVFGRPKGVYQRETPFDMQCKQATEDADHTRRPMSRVERELSAIDPPKPSPTKMDTTLKRLSASTMRAQVMKEKDLPYIPPPQPRQLSAAEIATQKLNQELHRIVVPAPVAELKDLQPVLLNPSNTKARPATAASVAAPYVRPGVANLVTGSESSMGPPKQAEIKTRSFTPSFHRLINSLPSSRKIKHNHTPLAPTAPVRLDLTHDATTGEVIGMKLASTKSPITSKFPGKRYVYGRRLNECDNEWRKANNLKPNFVLHTNQAEVEDNLKALREAQLQVAKAWKSGAERNHKPTLGHLLRPATYHSTLCLRESALDTDVSQDSVEPTIYPFLHQMTRREDLSMSTKVSTGLHTEVVADLASLRSASAPGLFPKIGSKNHYSDLINEKEKSVTPAGTSRRLNLGSPTLPRGTSIERSAATALDAGSSMKFTSYTDFQNKTLSLPLNLIDFGVIHTGVSYAYTFPIENLSPHMRKLRLDCAGWFDTPSCGQAALICKINAAAVPAGLKSRCYLFVCAVTAGALDGLLQLSTDDGNILQVNLKGYAMNPEIFHAARENVVRSKNTECIDGWKQSPSEAAIRAELDVEIPVDDGSVIPEVEQAFGTQSGSASLDASARFKTVSANSGGMFSSMRTKTSAYTRIGDKSQRVVFQNHATDVLARAAGILLGSADTGKLSDALQIDLDAAAPYRIPYGGTLETAIPLVLKRT